MSVSEIQTELIRLQIHPVNLTASVQDDVNIVLSGSLLAHWPVPKLVDGAWFLKLLKGLPDTLGPAATMDAFLAAHSEKSAALNAPHI